jgi:uncharacterized protein DUF3991/Toprim domain-containing protein
MSPIQKRADRVRGIALEPVLRLAGAQPDVHDRHKWHTSEGVISVTGSKFMNWTRSIGGGGAIDLVIHLNHRGFMEAVLWLERHFSAPTSVPSQQPNLQRSLQLPVASVQNLWRIKAYLATERGLPAVLTDPLIASGRIYADSKANVVFLLAGQNGRPVGAELRGTTSSRWRGMAPGSQKDCGFFEIGPSSTSSLVLCESAIDAISCCWLHPEYRCLSTAGARANPRWLSSLISHRIEIYCAYDADQVGDAMAKAMQTRHPEVKRLRPSRKDWNDVIRLK